MGSEPEGGRSLLAENERLREALGQGHCSSCRWIRDGLPGACECGFIQLRNIAQDMLDDHQTSDAHHPDHVLVRREDFERMRVLMAEQENRSGGCANCGQPVSAHVNDGSRVLACPPSVRDRICALVLEKQALLAENERLREALRKALDQLLGKRGVAGAYEVIVIAQAALAEQEGTPSSHPITQPEDDK